MSTLSRADAHQALLPRHGHPYHSLPVRPCRPETPICDRRVARLLAECCLGHWADSFKAEGVMLEDLAAGDAAWLKAYFPQLPAGPSRRLLALAATYADPDDVPRRDSPAAGFARHQPQTAGEGPPPHQARASAPDVSALTAGNDADSPFHTNALEPDLDARSEASVPDSRVSDSGDDDAQLSADTAAEATAQDDGSPGVVRASRCTGLLSKSDLNMCLGVTFSLYYSMRAYQQTLSCPPCSRRIHSPTPTGLISLIASTQRWILNPATGVVHPTRDGSTLLCLHKTIPHPVLLDAGAVIASQVPRTQGVLGRYMLCAFHLMCRCLHHALRRLRHDGHAAEAWGPLGGPLFSRHLRDLSHDLTFSVRFPEPSPCSVLVCATFTVRPCRLIACKYVVVQ